MPPRKKQSETPTVGTGDGQRDVRLVSGNAGSSPVVSGHNSDLSDDALIAENFKLEDLIKAASAKFDEWAKPHKERIAQIEGEISRRLLERGADSTKTDNGTAYTSDIMNTKIENQEILLDFVNEHWPEVGSDVKINVPIALVRSHMETNDGKPPPGISISYFKKLNIRRS